MSEITGTRYVLAVRNLKASANHYEQKLGFEVSELGASPGAPGWLVFSNGACVIMAGECPDDAPASDLGSHSYFAYIYIDGIDAYYDQVSKAGATIVKSLRNESWQMKEFSVRTIDGHRIMFGEPISKEQDT